MPETRECKAHYILLLGWFWKHFGDLTPIILQALHADATQAESDAGLASDGLVYELNALSNVTRGGNFKKGEKKLLETKWNEKTGQGRKKGKGADEDEIMDGGGVESEVKEVQVVVETVGEEVASGKQILAIGRLCLCRSNLSS